LIEEVSTSASIATNIVAGIRRHRYGSGKVHACDTAQRKCECKTNERLHGAIAIVMSIVMVLLQTATIHRARGPTDAQEKNTPVRDVYLLVMRP